MNGNDHCDRTVCFKGTKKKKKTSQCEEEYLQSVKLAYFCFKISFFKKKLLKSKVRSERFLLHKKRTSKKQRVFSETGGCGY